MNGTVDLVIPDIVFLPDLLRILGTSQANFYKLQKHNAFPIPELPRIDNKHRWSGKVVRKFIETGQVGSRLLR
jgi:predicted DNA-binding transcriptional regulator AlpA